VKSTDELEDAKDDRPPDCSVTDSTYDHQCSEDFREDGLCQQRLWTARFQVQDDQAGLKTLVAYPTAGPDDKSSRFVSHDNFVAGGQTPVALLYAGDCCRGGGATMAVTATDAEGNEATCRAGEPPPEGDAVRAAGSLGGKTTVGIVAGVSAGILLLAAVLAVVAVLVVKKKRGGGQGQDGR